MKNLLPIALVIIIISFATTTIIYTRSKKVDLNNPATYQNCLFNSDCKLVESTRACLEVEAINKQVPDEIWQDFLENKVPKTYDKCPRAELNINNSKAVCSWGHCKAVKK